MPERTEEYLAQMIAALPPVPTGWEQAARELPLAAGAIDMIVARCLAEQAERAAVLDDLESALREAGVEPREEWIERLRQRLI